MGKINEQIELFRKRSEISQEVRRMTFTPNQKRFLFDFLKINKNLVIGVLLTQFVRVLLEISLPLLGKVYTYRASMLLDRGVLYTTLAIFIIGIIIYLITAFLAFKFFIRLQTYLINSFRRSWYENYISRFQSKIFYRRNSALIAKVTYHFSLVQMGFVKALSSFLYLVFTIIGLFVVIPIVNPKLLVVQLIMVLLYIIVFSLGYFISRRYITKEQTLSSSIIEHITNGIINLNFINISHLESDNLKELDGLVDLDTHFRIRRNIWMNFGIKIIFVGITIFGVFLFAFTNEGINDLFGFSTSFISTGMIFAIMARMLYMSLNTGLYLYPLKLGLYLSLPLNQLKAKKVTKLKFENIEFKSKKAKIGNSKYFKNINFKFKKGDRINIDSCDYNINVHLAKLFSGELKNNLTPWIIKKDNKRRLYKNFVQLCNIGYYINPSFSQDLTIGEIIAGKSKFRINQNDINLIYQKLSEFSEFDEIFNLKRKIATKVTDSFTLKDQGLYQFAHVFTFPPKIITVDSIWQSLDEPVINSLIQKMSDLLKESTIVIFNNKDSNLKFNQVYEVKKDKIVSKK